LPQNKTILEGQYNHFGVVSKTLSGRLNLIYRKGSDHHSYDAGAVYLSSDDNGNTWSDEKVIIPSNGDDVRVGCIGTSKTGRLIVAYIRKESASSISWHHIYSDDEGDTWSNEKDFDTSLRWGLPYGRIIQLTDGRLLVTGESFIDTDANGNSDTFIIGNWYSDDDGETWYRGISQDEYSAPGYLFAEHSVVQITDQVWLSVTRGLYSFRFHKTFNAGLSWIDQGEFGTISYDVNAFNLLVAPMLDIVERDGKKYILLTFSDRQTDKSQFMLGNTEDFLANQNGRVRWGELIDFRTGMIGLSGYQTGLVTGPNRDQYYLVDFFENTSTYTTVQQTLLDLSDSNLFAGADSGQSESLFVGEQISNGSFTNWSSGTSFSFDVTPTVSNVASNWSFTPSGGAAIITK
jgi:hypothetical protein